MNRDRLYVAICTPNEPHLTPYVYGVFVEEEYAVEHFEKHGDKTSTLRVTHEQVMHRSDADNVSAAKQVYESLEYVKQNAADAMDNAMQGTYGRPFEG